jgi:hypothetical protein
MAVSGRDKLKLLNNSEPPPPIGTRYAFGEHGCIWFGFSLVMFAIAGMMLATFHGSAGDTLLFAGAPATVGLLCLAVARIRYRSPRTPARATKNFYEFIARKNYEAAWDMLVPTERGNMSGPFREFAGFREYWQHMRKHLELRSGKLSFGSIRLWEHPSGLAVCQLTLHAAPNQFIATGLAGFGSIALGEDRTFRIQKLLVPSGGEWYMWSGEFQSDDEADLSWLSE